MVKCMCLNVGPRDDFYPMPSMNPCGMERSIGRPENNGNGAHCAWRAGGLMMGSCAKREARPSPTGSHSRSNGD